MYNINNLQDKPITEQELLTLREHYVDVIERAKAVVDSWGEAAGVTITEEVYENTLIRYIESASNYIIKNRVQAMLIEGLLSGDLTAIPSLFVPSDLVFGVSENLAMEGTGEVDEWLNKRIAIWRVTKESQADL